MCKEVYVDARPGNVIRGKFDPNKVPIAEVNPGDVVTVETVSTIGILDPFEEYIRKYELDSADPVISKMLATEELERIGEDEHTLTGPIYIKGAMPGDMVEIKILETNLITDFGNSKIVPGYGGVPDLIDHAESFRWTYDKEKNVAVHDGYEIDIKPFFGIMAMTPAGGQVSSPPGRFGGNLDLKELRAGTTLFLPVEVEGGMFYVGDAHAAQGNGEVCLTAIETSLEGKFEFILHKNKEMTAPRAESDTHYIAIGLDEDLNVAIHKAIEESAKWVAELKNISFYEALMLCSTSVDYCVTQVVDNVKGIHAMISKETLKLA